MATIILTVSVSLRSPLSDRNPSRRLRTNREPFRLTVSVSSYISFEEIERRVAVLPVILWSIHLTTGPVDIIRAVIFQIGCVEV